jgi:predicted amidohydrolase YtcJ
MCDLILFNANVITMDPKLPRAELIAVAGGHVVSVGGNEELGKLRESGAKIIDCMKRTVLPGFTDAHCHVRAYAESLISLDLSPHEGTRTIHDIQNRIRDCSKNQLPGTWIKGKGYSEFHLAEIRHPTRWDLDAAALHHPVKLTHRSGHAHVLNSLALQYAEITAETGDPPGAMIDRDPESGEPTGILYGMNAYLAGKFPSSENADIEQGLVLANQKLLSFGITSIQDVSPANGLYQWKRFEEMKAQGILQPRLTMTVGWNAFAGSQFKSFKSFLSKADLRSGGVKIVTGHTTGSLHPSREVLNEQVSAIHEAGFQAIIHAIEESEIEAACNAVAYALKKRPRQDHRHRIEHCSVCPPSLQRRLAELGIIVVTQPSFIYYSGDRYLRTVPGDQLDHLYPIGSMLDHGIQMGAGSDIPISHPDPMVGIYAAVTRTAESGERVLSNQAISVYDALKMYTSGAAAAGFGEDRTGSISPGKAADFVVLDQDPFAVNAGQIKDIHPVLTILGGKIVWNKN